MCKLMNNLGMSSVNSISIAWSLSNLFCIQCKSPLRFGILCVELEHNIINNTIYILQNFNQWIDLLNNIWRAMGTIIKYITEWKPECWLKFEVEIAQHLLPREGNNKIGLTRLSGLWHSYFNYYKQEIHRRLTWKNWGNVMVTNLARLLNNVGSNLDNSWFLTHYYPLYLFSFELAKNSNLKNKMSLA